MPIGRAVAALERLMKYFGRVRKGLHESACPLYVVRACLMQPMSPHAHFAWCEPA